MKPICEKMLRLMVGTKLKAQAPLVQFDAARIGAMDVTSVRSADDPLEMHFYAVMMDDGCEDLDNEKDDTKSRAWARAPRKAA
jgi:hypothetical protein